MYGHQIRFQIPDNRHQDGLRQLVSYRAPYHQIEDGVKRRKSYISKDGVPIDHVCKYTQNPPMILIDAVYVHHSGVRILLDVLIRTLQNRQADVYYVLDERIRGQYDHLGPDKVLYIPGTARARLAYYRQHQHRFRRIVCFSSVPPLIRIDGECLVYLQSTLMITLNGVTALTLLRRIAYNLYMRLTRRNVDRWLVQTRHMKEVAIRFTREDQGDIRVIPFFHEIQCQPKPRDDKFRFLYVSEGYPHKNHRRLFEAFERAWTIKPDIVLHVTVGAGFPAVLNDIDKVVQRGVPIVNEGFLPHHELVGLYGRVRAQVYPSVTEAFGIGLIESTHAGLPVIAADRPYVHELIHPTLTFDPTDVADMTRCLIEARESDVLAPATLNIQSHHEELADLILEPTS